jgi:hypothetical protein
MTSSEKRRQEKKSSFDVDLADKTKTAKDPKPKRTKDSKPAPQFVERKALIGNKNKSRPGHASFKSKKKHNRKKR